VPTARPPASPEAVCHQVLRVVCPRDKERHAHICEQDRDKRSPRGGVEADTPLGSPRAGHTQLSAAVPATPTMDDGAQHVE